MASLRPAPGAEWASALAAPHSQEIPAAPGRWPRVPSVRSPCPCAGVCRSWPYTPTFLLPVSVPVLVPAPGGGRRPRPPQCLSSVLLPEATLSMAFTLTQQMGVPACDPALGSRATSPSQSGLGPVVPSACPRMLPAFVRVLLSVPCGLVKLSCLPLLAPGHVMGFCVDHMCKGGQEGW